MPCDRSFGPDLHALLLVHDLQSQSPQQTPADVFGIGTPAAETAAAAAAASHSTIAANCTLCTAIAPQTARS